MPSSDLSRDDRNPSDQSDWWLLDNGMAIKPSIETIHTYHLMDYLVQSAVAPGPGGGGDGGGGGAAGGGGGGGGGGRDGSGGQGLDGHKKISIRKINM